MKYYVAETFANKLAARQFVRDMNREWDFDHGCTARWVFAEDDEEGLVGDVLPAGAKRFAETDLEDLRRSDALVLLVSDRDSPGKTYEAGFFHGLHVGSGCETVPIYPVGGDRLTRSIFRTMWHPQVTVGEFLANPFPLP